MRLRSAGAHLTSHQASPAQESVQYRHLTGVKRQLLPLSGQAEKRKTPRIRPSYYSGDLAPDNCVVGGSPVRVRHCSTQRTRDELSRRPSRETDGEIRSGPCGVDTPLGIPQKPAINTSSSHSRPD